MFFIFGTRSKSQGIKQVSYNCKNCGKPTVHMGIETKRWFTLFFIPVIPLGASYSIRCNLCGLTLKAGPKLVDQLTGRAPLNAPSAPASTTAPASSQPPSSPPPPG